VAPLSTCGVKEAYPLSPETLLVKPYRQLKQTIGI
jgi:hypothetical protein